MINRLLIVVSLTILTFFIFCAGLTTDSSVAADEVFQVIEKSLKDARDIKLNPDGSLVINSSMFYAQGYKLYDLYTPYGIVVDSVSYVLDDSLVVDVQCLKYSKWGLRQPGHDKYSKKFACNNLNLK